MAALLEAFVGDFVQISGDPLRNSIVLAMLMLLGSRRAESLYRTEDSRHLESLELEVAPGLECSILGYGVGDLHRLRSAQHIDSYCDELASSILTFDRRLAAVSVRPDSREGDHNNSLRLMISVRLRGQEESIGLATHIHLTDGNCNIQEQVGD